MKKIFIISFLIFIILVSILNNTIFASNPNNVLLNEAEITNAIINHAHNTALTYNQAVANEQAQLDEYMNYLNSFNSNNSNVTALPQTGSSFIIPLLILLSLSSVMFLTIKIKKYKDIV